jgi:hypothetical protein
MKSGMSKKRRRLLRGGKRAGSVPPGAIDEETTPQADDSAIELPRDSGVFALGDATPQPADTESTGSPEPEPDADFTVPGVPRPRKRGLVAGAIAFAGVVMIAMIGKALITRRAPPAPRSSVPVVTAVAASNTAPPVTTPSAPAPSDPPEQAPSAAQKTDDAEAPDKPAPPERSLAATRDPARKASDPPGSDETLKRQALSLLNKGALSEAIPVAKEAVAADPTDALGYLYLGSALQGVGRAREAIEVYSECVRHATRGPVSECRLMGGHR